MLETFDFKKKLDTIEDHHNKHTIEDQCCSPATPLKQCLGAMFHNMFINKFICCENGAF